MAYEIEVLNETELTVEVTTEGIVEVSGEKGETGPAGTIEVGTVTTLPAGSPATVTNIGTEEEAVFDFGIPQGEQGEGSATVSIIGTNTVEPGVLASVVNTGTPTAAELTFNIPKGNKGDTGLQGDKGDKGDTGLQGIQGEKGDKGDTGLQGLQGEIGPKGDKGDTGTAATVAVGSTATLEPGNNATVVNSGTTAAAILDFGIPQGKKGEMLNHVNIIDLNISGSTAERSLFNTGSPFSSLTIPANTIQDGDTILWSMGGKVTTPAGTAGTSTIKAKVGSVNVFNSTANLMSGISNQGSSLSGCITFRKKNGLFYAVGGFNVNIWNSSNQGNVVGRSGGTTPGADVLIDATIDNKFDLTIQFSNIGVSLNYVFGYMSIMTTSEFNLGHIADITNAIRYGE